jgi:signal transduction histidine kinase
MPRFGLVKRFLRSPRGQIAAVAVGLFGAALLVAGVALMVSLSTVTERDMDAALVDQAKTVSNDFLDGNNQVLSADLPRETPSGVPVATVIVDPAGAVVAESDEPPLRPRDLSVIAVQARAESLYWTYLMDQKGIRRRVYATRLDPAGSVLVVSRSQTEESNTLVVAGLLLGGISIVLLTVDGWLAYWLAGRVLRPVHKIASLARKISEHDLHRRLDVRAPDDELGELVTTFNEMLARLEESFEGLRRFTADASHELRSPLAVMRSELERGLARSRTAEGYREVLEWVLGDVEHMGRLLDQILVLTRADAGTLRLARESIDVADFLYESAARWGGTAEAHGVSIEVEAPASGFVLADKTLLRRTLDSMLDNAIRHAPPGSVVHMRAVLDGSGLDIEVADAGPGVPVELRLHLFTGFARPDSVRSRGGSGAGLSLAASAAIARAHGGRMDLVERDGAGATFRLHLPTTPALA